MPCSGVDKSLLHRSSLGTWRQGAEIPWVSLGISGTSRVHPSLLWGQAAEGAGLLLAVLSSQGHCIFALQLPPFLLRLETYPLPPWALTKAPLTLSPSDFPSRGFEELGFAGGGRNETH